MKKWIVFILIFILIVAGIFYFTIPKNIHLQQGISIAVNAKGFSRTIMNEKNWLAWWPGEIITNTGKGYGSFRFNNSTYSIVEKRHSSFVISIGNNKDSFSTELLFIPLKADSIVLNWQGRIASPMSSDNRFQLYYKTKKQNDDLKMILRRIQQFYAKEENLYGREISKEYVLDSTLISTSGTSQGYPTTESIYQLVNNLKNYAEKNGAKQTGHPMLNIYTADSTIYITKVALPVEKKLKDSGNISYRWMLGGGRILVTEVKGGPYAIQKAFTEMENYISDFQHTAPAIPFQSLITDRSKEPDTSKWTTKLYWPVM